MVTSAESPDCNPMETHLWHELKGREVKPQMKDELVQHIQEFWKTSIDVQPEVSQKIRHLRKVVPKVIELNGAATGY